MGLLVCLYGFVIVSLIGCLCACVCDRLNNVLCCWWVGCLVVLLHVCVVFACVIVCVFVCVCPHVCSCVMVCLHI